MPLWLVRLRAPEHRLSALCSLWRATRRMGEDAPHLPFAISAGIGSMGWKAAIQGGANSRIPCCDHSTFVAKTMPRKHNSERTA